MEAFYLSTWALGMHLNLIHLIPRCQVVVLRDAYARDVDSTQGVVQELDRKLQEATRKAADAER